jgi:hypothetical protein
MSSSYDRNIERMRSREKFNVQQGNAQRTNMANTMGSRGIQEAGQLSDQLSAFSSTLKEMRKKDIEEKQERGRIEAQEAQEENAQKLVDLETELSTLTETDTRYHEIKGEMLKMSGPDVYPDADRIAQLSPWGQVGYAKEKLRMFNETFPDKLNHAMANSEKAIKIQGIKFTPKELHANNIHGLPFKEAAMQAVSDDIKKAAGLDRFSPELLELAGTNSAIQKAKETTTAKYRQRYNVEASSNTRSKAQLAWKTSGKTGTDIHHYLTVTGATMDANNNHLGKTGAWKALEGLLVEEGISSFDDEYATKILNQVMPDNLAKQVGAKKGTTYAQHWSTKAATLQLEIQNGIKSKLDSENGWLRTSGTKKQNEFIQEVRSNGMTETRANEYKAWYSEFGLTIPNSIKNWESTNDVSVREAKDQIDAIIAYNKGEITHAQLDQFPQEAAIEYREKATAFEKASLSNSGAEKKIKAALDSTFADMGIKTNEKSLAYIEANENAKADFITKRNRLIGMGYGASRADHLALFAEMGEIQDAEGNPIPGEIEALKEEWAKDGEQAKLTEDYKAQVDDLTSKLSESEGKVKDLEAEVDKYTLIEAEREKKENVNKLLSESDLSDSQVSEVFVKTLMSLDGDEEIKKHIADRVEIVNEAQNSGIVEGNGERTTESVEEVVETDDKSEETASWDADSFVKSIKRSK